MSRRIKLSSLLIVLSCIISNAQDRLPNNSISFTAGMNYDGGYEVSIGTENYFNSNHTASLYGLINYHYAEENWFGQSVDCKKAMGEIGGKYYFRVVRNKFYPYLGLGITAGIQDIKQNTFYNSGESVVDEDRDPLLLGVFRVHLEEGLQAGLRLGLRSYGDSLGKARPLSQVQPACHRRYLYLGRKNSNLTLTESPLLVYNNTLRSYRSSFLRKFNERSGYYREKQSAEMA